MSRRQRGAPLAVIAGIAMVPALALGGVWGYANAKVPAPTTTTTTTVPPPPADELATELMSLRRYPTPIAASIAAEERSAIEATIAADLVDVVASVDGDSCLRVVDDGDEIASSDPAAALIPASNQKLVVAAVALDVLGPDFRFRTEVRGATPVNGVIPGDITLVGGGDPLLRSGAVPDPSRYPEFNITELQVLADRLVALGVTRVDGDVIGDESRYDDERRVPSWDDGITRADAGLIGALVVDDGRLTTGDFAIAPASAAARSFEVLLTERGVTVGGTARVGEAPDGATALAVIESMPLTDVLVELLHTSDNHTAEMLVKEIGVAVSAEGTRRAGLDAMRARLADWEVPLDGVVLDDGSGLSRENRLTCDALTTLLGDTVAGASIVELLPVAGRDGTLQDQFIGTRAEAELRAKTGTLTDVKALTGIVPDGAGDDVDVAVVLNSVDADAAATYQPIWLELVDVVGRLPVVVEPDVDAIAP